MPNAYFNFKQFTVYHDKCALKVCTDSCLFGAWAVAFTKEAYTILDIGSGSGLLSLILAQKTNAEITGVELDESSFLQALENIKQSPWPDKIKLIHADCRNYFPAEKFDFIICNPPFYEQMLSSEKNNEKQAKHDATLLLSDLISIFNRLLSPKGKLAILFPYYRKVELLKAMSMNGYYLHAGVDIRPAPQKDNFRFAGIFGHAESVMPSEIAISIKDELQHYTPEFKALLKDYYLYL